MRGYHLTCMVIILYFLVIMLHVLVIMLLVLVIMLHVLVIIMHVLVIMLHTWLSCTCRSYRVAYVVIILHVMVMRLILGTPDSTPKLNRKMGLLMKIRVPLLSKNSQITGKFLTHRIKCFCL